MKTAERRVLLRHRSEVRYKQNEGVRDTGSAVTATTNEELWGKRSQQNLPWTESIHPSKHLMDLNHCPECIHLQKTENVNHFLP